MPVLWLLWNVFLLKAQAAFQPFNFLSLFFLAKVPAPLHLCKEDTGTNTGLQSTCLPKSPSHCSGFWTRFMSPYVLHVIEMLLRWWCGKNQITVHFRPLDSTNYLFADFGFGFNVLIAQIIQAVNSPHFEMDSRSKQSRWWVWCTGWPTCCCIDCVSEINLWGLRPRRDPHDENEAAVLLEHAWGKIELWLEGKVRAMRVVDQIESKQTCRRKYCFTKLKSPDAQPIKNLLCLFCTTYLVFPLIFPDICWKDAESATASPFDRISCCCCLWLSQLHISFFGILVFWHHNPICIRCR